jgi:hypothetical protein
MFGSRPSFPVWPARFVRVGMLLALMIWQGDHVLAQSAKPSRVYTAEAVRAVLLVNIIRFTDWPLEELPEGMRVVIGVAGSRAAEDELIELSKTELIHERQIHIVRIKTSLDLAGCHAVFINPRTNPGEESAPGAEELLPLIQGRAILTVSESPTFIVQGGMVNLYQKEDGKLGFEIAPETALANRLVLSSRLLALARIVRPSVP